MVTIAEIIRDTSIDDGVPLGELGITVDDAAKELSETAGLVVGVPHEPDARIDFYRECLVRRFAEQFNVRAEGTVGRLRAVVGQVARSAYPGT